MALPYVRNISSQVNRSDQMFIDWSDDASKLLGCPIHGDCYIVDWISIHYWPEHEEAESWWHLCALIGIQEQVARVFYKELGSGEHP